MEAERVDETRWCPAGAGSRLREDGEEEGEAGGIKRAKLGVRARACGGSCRRSARVSFGRRYGTLEA